jgi:hypothetical protein
MKKTDPDIIVEQAYNATLDEVWEDKMKVWYFPQIESFEAKKGFETSFVVKHNGRTFTHKWEVRESFSPYKLSYRWYYEEYPGDSEISFELREEGSNVVLFFRDTALADFPSDIPEFKRESAVAGWDYLLKVCLKAYLEDE